MGSIISRVRSAAARWLLRSAFPDASSVARWLAGEDETMMGPRRYTVPSRPYRTEPWVRKCVAARAQALAGVPIVVSTVDGEPIESGPLVEALATLVRGGRYGLVYQIAGNYSLSGEAHLIAGLQSAKADTVDVWGAYNNKAIVSDDGYSLLGWEVSLKNKAGQWVKYPLDLGSVESWIDWNIYPDTRFRGLSALEALAITLSEDRSAAEHNAVLLASGGGPKGFVKTEAQLTPDQAKVMEERFAARYGGTGKSGSVAILGNGTEWQSMTMNNADLMLIESRQLARETICSLFDVPADVAGFQVTSGSTSGAHTSSTREGWYVNSIWPQAQQIGDLLTRFFVPRYGAGANRGRTHARNPAFKAALKGYRAAGGTGDVIIWLDMAQVPAMRAWLNSQADAALKWLDAGVPLNDIIEKCDAIPFEPTEWGEDYWIPSGMTTARWQLEHLDDAAMPEADPQAPEDEPPDDDEETEPETEDDAPQEDMAFTVKMTVKDSAMVWRRWVRSWGSLEARTRAAMATFFRRQERDMLAKLEAANVASVKAMSDVALNLVRENRLLIELMMPQWRAGMNLGADQIGKEAGIADPFKMTDEWFARLLPQRFAKVVNINATTQGKLRKQLQLAQDAGENVNEIQARVKGVFKEATYSRSLAIARTESAMSVSTGRAIAMKEDGIGRKAWLTAGDEHVRASHRAAGAKYRAGIPLGDKFRVGNAELDHPCDPNCGVPGEIINCRCVILPIVEKATDWRGYRFMSLAESEKESANERRESDG